MRYLGILIHMEATVTGRSIAKNTTFYISALTLQKGLSFLYFTLVARSFGANLTGKYFFALSLAGIVIGIVDIGLTPVLTREVAKDRNTARSILGHTLLLKASLGLIMVIGTVVMSGSIAPDMIQRQLLFIALAIALFDTASLSLFATVRAHQNLWYESISAVLFQVVVLCFGGFAIYKGAHVTVVMLALLAGSIVNSMIGGMAVRKMLASSRGMFRIDKKMFIRLLYLAAPFAIATLCIKANAYTDTILVKALLDDTAVGLYSVAYKITFAFQFIPMAFVASLYPAFAYLWQQDALKLSKTFVQASTYLLIFSVPIVALIASTADIVIPLVYRPEYLGSVAPLIVLVMSLPMLFLNFPIGSLLNAIGRQNRQTIHLAVGVVATVLFNVTLIPIFGILGAALASLASTVTVFILGIFVTHRIINFDALEYLMVFVRIGIAGLVCFLVIIMVRSLAPWYGAAAVGAIAYCVVLWFARIVTPETLQNIRLILRRT